METISYIHKVVIPAAFRLLPAKMDTKESEAMVLATGLQESMFKFRHQQVGGPAGGFWQFEDAGVNGVMRHDASRALFTDIVLSMAYPLDVKLVQDSLDHNDILACAVARLLLWTHPSALPSAAQPLKGWEIYRSCWRPGKPHPEKWEGNFKRAWQIVNP